MLADNERCKSAWNKNERVRGQIREENSGVWARTEKKGGGNILFFSSVSEMQCKMQKTKHKNYESGGVYRHCRTLDVKPW